MGGTWCPKAQSHQCAPQAGRGRFGAYTVLNTVRRQRFEPVPRPANLPPQPFGERQGGLKALKRRRHGRDPRGRRPPPPPHSCSQRRCLFLRRCESCRPGSLGKGRVKGMGHPSRHWWCLSRAGPWSCSLLVSLHPPTSPASRELMGRQAQPLRQESCCQPWPAETLLGRSHCPLSTLSRAGVGSTQRPSPLPALTNHSMGAP